ncbi:MAG: hypothetical protein IJE43_19275 [Alphaproteobacteria bacterium]|nr:hypothetical protein [Alphaproteobacteria bacterium]
MDIVLALVICLVGLTRINTDTKVVVENTVVNEITGEVRNTYDNLEVGTNLFLKKDSDAFMYYVKELVR